MKNLNWKRWMTMSCLSLFVCVASAQQKDWANLGRYAADNAALAKPTAGERRVVFMGNSITEGWVKIHPEFFSSRGYVGRGISGQTSSQFLLRFREDVIHLQPTLVVINAGTNDVAENTGPYNENVTFGNIVSMVELAQANQIKVILTSVLPAAAFRWRPSITDSSEKISRLNSRIKAYASAHRIPYVDYYTSMVTGADQALNPQFTKDGVHPTAEGYVVMEELIQQTIDRLLR